MLFRWYHLNMGFSAPQPLLYKGENTNASSSF